MNTSARLVFLILLIAAAAGAEEKQVYRIGVILPLSGQVASLGEYVRDGLQLALRDLPAAQRQSISVEFEDDQFDPKRTVSAYHALAARGRLDAVFVIGSPPANALVPLTERKKQILVAIGGSDPSISVGRRFAFIHWVTPDVLGRRLAEELVRRRLRRIAFVSAEVTGCLADLNGALRALEQLGAADTVVYNRSFSKEETDFRAPIAEIKNVKAQAVVVILFPGALSSFAKQARRLSLSAELVGMETFEDRSEVQAADGALDGAWYVNAAAADSSFSARYQNAFGRPPGWASANAYDTLRLVAEAAAASGGENEPAARWLSSVKDYSGAAGKYSASGDHRFLLPAALRRVRPDAFVDIDKSDGH